MQSSTITRERIAQFRYFKIQLETKDITTRLREINDINLLNYSPKPRSDVFCFKLNFNISKLGYCDPFWGLSGHFIQLDE